MDWSPRPSARRCERSRRPLRGPAADLLRASHFDGEGLGAKPTRTAPRSPWRRRPGRTTPGGKLHPVFRASRSRGSSDSARRLRTCFPTIRNFAPTWIPVRAIPITQLTQRASLVSHAAPPDGLSQSADARSLWTPVYFLVRLSCASSAPFGSCRCGDDLFERAASPRHGGRARESDDS